MTRKTALLITLALLVLCGGITAAGGYGNQDDNKAKVRVFHASPSPTPNVDVIANQALTLFEDVAFGSVTDYAMVDASVYFIEVVETGTTAPAVIEGDLSLFYGTDYTVVATDELDMIMPVVLIDDSSDVEKEMTRVRVFHGSPDTGAVQVRAVDGPVWVESVEFQNSSGYITVPSGMYELEVSVIGTDIAVTIPADLPEESVVTVWAIGRLGDGSIQFVPTVDSSNDSADRDDDDDNGGPRFPWWLRFFR
jgi:hypothetical protein